MSEVRVGWDERSESQHHEAPNGRSVGQSQTSGFASSSRPTRAALSANATSIMHWRRGDNRNTLRYLPRPLRYNNPDGTKEEKQWDTIKRT
jgi:hypothetical protein